MRSFLKDADRTENLNERERSWVANVRDMCYRVEDIIEEFMYHLQKERRDGKLAKLVHGAIHLPKNLWIRHRIAKEIQGINKSLKSIPEVKQRYDGIQIERHQKIDDDQKRAQYQSELLVYAKMDHVVGIEDDKKQLLDWLTDGEAESKVISVVGMGGCGKSTLAAKVYNDPIVRSRFDCYAWVTVSQTYVIDDLLNRIINELYRSTEMKGVPKEQRSKGSTDLAKFLIDYLRPKKYLIVLDDVWSNNLWKDLEIILSDEGLGSRLILTTRNDEIANADFGVRSHVLHVKPLEDGEAWDLFCSKAFSTNGNRAYTKEIESIARDLVRKCNGLPLAILALGGAMYLKKTASEWRNFQASLHHELSSKDNFKKVMDRILLFSFKDLSYRLKHCFLYCCIFPEDYPIKRKRLIKLWMAEGFIEEASRITPEDVADNYLLELVNRNMLQVVERNPHGRPKECKMHDMMRELALYISKKEKFCSVYDSQVPGEEVSVPARRLSIQTDSINKAKSLNGISQLRSLFLFPSILSKINPLPSGFRFLRVLDLEGLPIKKLPNEIVNLFNLRYLNLRGTEVKELPRSIARLRNLETLDIKYTGIKMIPAGIVELKKLRHLQMDRIRVPWSICELKDLQTLVGVEAEPRLLKEIKSMTQLTSIGMTEVKKEYEKDLCTAIGQMNLLRNLSLSVTNIFEQNLAMDTLSAAPPYLKELFLDGKMEKVPSWFNSLRNLTTLCLLRSRLSEDPLPSIQSLPYLHHLYLINAYEGGQLCFSSGFSKLKYLELRGMEQLNNVSIKEGVMPALKELIIDVCFGLKRVPQGIEHLQALEKLFLGSVSAELVESISGEQSEDRPRVRHIPTIRHYKDLSPSGWDYENL